MITTGNLIDLKTSAAFQQARHQNNMYVAQEMLKSAADGSGDPSEKLQEVHKAIADIDFTTAADKNARINMIQDALAMQHIYLTADQIDHHFLDSKGEVKTALTNSTMDESAWGLLAFDMMKEGLQGYLAKNVKKPGKTHDEYAALNKKLAQVKPIANRNDLWGEVNKAADLEEFAKKVNFNQAKIDAHRKYLDAGFFALAENNWWHAASAVSKFRDQVGKDYKPECYMRATSTPQRGSFQGSKTDNSTRRVVFKNPPWSMTQLAKLFNGATHAAFTDGMAGSEPPVSTLAGKPNPFHNVVFQINGTGTWYIMGGHVDSGDNLILDKVELVVDSTTGKPQKDTDGNYVTKKSTGGTDIASMFSATDMSMATDEHGKPMVVSKVIEDGLATLIEACGFGVTANNKPPEEQIVQFTAEAAAPVLFVMDDTALLREWVRDLGPPIAPAVSPAVLSPTDQVIYDVQQAVKKGNEIDFLHANPGAYNVLAAHYAAKHIDSRVEAIQKRDAAQIAKFSPEDKQAFRAMMWGGVLDKFMELGANIVPPRTIGNVVNELELMVSKEDRFFAGPVWRAPIPMTLESVLQEITGQFNTANTAANTSTLFQEQRQMIFDEIHKGFGAGAATPPVLRFVDFKARASFTAANIIPMPNSAPYTAQERNALQAIAWTDVMRRLIKAAEDPNADLKQELINAIKEQKGVLPDLTPGELAAITNNDQALLFARQQINIQMGLLGGAPYTNNRFASNCGAIERVRNACKGASVAAILAAPPTDKMFKDAGLASVEMEIVARKYRNDPEVAIGFVRRPDADGKVVVEAASSGTDYLNIGMMHYRKMHDSPIGIDVNGKKLYLEQCPPPATNAIPGKTYFQVMEHDPNTNKLTVAKLTNAERAELQKGLLVALKELADEAMKQGVVRPDAVNVAQVTPNKDNITAADINGLSNQAVAAGTPKRRLGPTQ